MTVLRRRLHLWSAVVAIVVIATACSGGSSTSKSSKTSVPAASTTGTTNPSGPTTSSQPNCVSNATIAGWSSQQRAAQLIVLPVLDFNVAGLTSLIQSGTGGLLFLGSADAPSDLATRISAATTKVEAVNAPLVMADVEGGGVQRMEPVVKPFPWPREVAATMSPAASQSLANNVGQQMHGAGVNVDLAPVVDLDDRPGPSASNPDGQRSFSLNANTASNYGIAYMNGLEQAGVLPVLKHFPGLGGSTTNTDFGPAATQPLSALQTAGLVPFRNAIAAGAPAIMVGNAYTPGLTTKPASVSPEAIQGLLRDQMGFQKLVVTDSLSAGAVRQAGYDVPGAATAAITAGADMVLFGSTLTPADTALLSPSNVAASQQAIIAALTTALQNGALPANRLNNAVAHVLTAKGMAICAT